MVKGSHTSSILTGKDKYCYLTGEERGLEKHHIYFGAGLRQISDKHGFWVWLTAEMHRGTEGVHGTCERYKAWNGKRQAERQERIRRTSILHEADKRKSAAVSHYKRRGRQA